MKFSELNQKEYGGYTPGNWENVEGVAEICNQVSVTYKEFIDKETGEVNPTVSLCFFKKSGRVSYEKVSRDSNLKVGDLVDMDSIRRLPLTKGTEVIYRWDGKALPEED